MFKKYISELQKNKEINTLGWILAFLAYNELDYCWCVCISSGCMFRDLEFM